LTGRPLRAAIVATATALPLAACAHALREPPAVDRVGQDILGAGESPAAPGDVDGLVAEGDRGFARRPEAEAVEAAQRAFLRAARVEDGRVEGLVGLARVSVWRIEHAGDEKERQALVPVALQAAQWCGRRLPEDPRCDYWLAVALGLQAREHPPTAHDAVGRMVDALRRAIARDPRLEDGAPHRVLALVLLRAPGWPLGPGDSEEGLREAERAVVLFPDHPPNQIALGEALRRNGRPAESQRAYGRARDLALALAAAGAPDAAEWEEEAAEALARP
jgi:hypothetical protein